MNLALKKADEKRLQVIRSTNDSCRASFSQYLTPPETAFLAVHMFSESNEHLQGLDLGAGTGILSVALFEKYNRRVSIDAVEYDEQISRHFKAEAEKLRMEYRLFEQDVLFWSSAKKYDRVILNPPYKKMNASDLRMHKLPVKVPNLYAAFVCIAVEHLRPGGECVAIIPRSWMNGQYFIPFRQWLLRNVSLDAFHIYESRGDVFSDTDVLQEIMLVKLSKRKQGKTIKVSSSTGRQSQVNCEEYKAEQLIDCTTDDVVIGIKPKNKAMSYYANLAERGFCASTGKVVDFRAREYVQEEKGEASVELIYPCNFSGMMFFHPVSRGKKQWFNVVDDFSRKQLIGSGSYVIVKRFSAKEEKKRVYASLLDIDHAVALENHLNFIHAGTSRSVVALDPQIAKGLTIWLNSTVIDNWFRTISGSTQVNASDLKKAPTPSKSVLLALGKQWSPSLAQEEVDCMCSEVTHVSE